MLARETDALASADGYAFHPGWTFPLMLTPSLTPELTVPVPAYARTQRKWKLGSVCVHAACNLCILGCP